MARNQGPWCPTSHEVRLPPPPKGATAAGSRSHRGRHATRCARAASATATTARSASSGGATPRGHPRCGTALRPDGCSMCLTSEGAAARRRLATVPSYRRRAVTSTSSARVSRARATTTTAGWRAARMRSADGGRDDAGVVHRVFPGGIEAFGARPLPLLCPVGRQVATSTATSGWALSAPAAARTRGPRRRRRPPR